MRRKNLTSFQCWKKPIRIGRQRFLFDRVNEPGLIEHAIYNLNAAEKRYHFLLNEARKEKLTNPILGDSLVEGGKYQKEDA